MVGDASHFKDPLSAHGISDALRDAEFLATALDAALRGRDETEALSEYEAMRDRLSTDLHEVTDELAGFEWDLPRVKKLLIEMSRAMSPEIPVLEQLDVLSDAA